MLKKEVKREYFIEIERDRGARQRERERERERERDERKREWEKDTGDDINVCAISGASDCEVGRNKVWIEEGIHSGLEAAQYTPFYRARKTYKEKE